MSITTRITRLFIVLTISVAALPYHTYAQANFDDLPAVQNGAIPFGYQNHNWYYGIAGFGTGFQGFYTNSLAPCRSAPNCSYNPNGVNNNIVMRIESLNTNASSAFTFAAWVAGTSTQQGGGPAAIRVEGFVGGSNVAAFSSLFPMLNSVYSFVDVSSIAVNRIIITPTDLNGAATKGGIALDDVTFGTLTTTPPSTTAPEPSTLALMATGIAAVIATRRKSFSMRGRRG